jgi:hypothetical protein
LRSKATSSFHPSPRRQQHQGSDDMVRAQRTVSDRILRGGRFLSRERSSFQRAMLCVHADTGIPA